MAKKSKKQGMPAWQKAAIGGFAGLVLGAGALVVGFSMVEAYQIQMDRIEDKDPPVQVVVAARTMYPGVKIRSEDLFALELPSTLVSSGMITNPEEIIGKYPKERVLANEFARRERLADPENGEGLNAVLPRGMRALSIEISNGPALSGHLQPGNYVDVLLTYGEESNTAADKKTKTIAQAMFVLAVNTRSVDMSPEESRARPRRAVPAVTLLTTPEEAKLVAFAEAAGNVHLSLRNDLDQSFADSEGTNLTRLLEAFEARTDTLGPDKTRGRNR